MLATLPTLSPSVLQFTVFLLVTVSMGAALLGIRPRRAEAVRLKSRLEALGGSRQHDRPRGGGSEESRRRRLVEETLRELESKQSARTRKRSRPTLRGRMRQAGLSWTEKTYVLVSAGIALAAWGAALAGARLGWLPAAGFGLTAGLLLPHLYLTRLRASRLKRFEMEFPNALDVIVRGVKAGLPLADCLRIIAAEAQQPVSREFETVAHDQTVGVPLDEAVERLAERVPLPETNFFAIVLGIQSRSGGNLSEALGNLSKVLRERKHLREKVKAMSAEAKSSAGIIGSMPVVVAVLLYFTSPDYVALLFETNAGNIALAASAVWMFVGSMVMRKMINFDF